MTTYYDKIRANPPKRRVRRDKTCQICGEKVTSGGTKWLCVPHLGHGPGVLTELLTHDGACTTEAYKRLGWCILEEDAL